MWRDIIIDPVIIVDLRKRFVKEVNSQSVQLVELCQSLVQRPSENPPGDERAVAELVAKELISLGFEVELVEANPKRVNALAILKGSGGGRNILFNGHMDTVPIGDRGLWTVDPLQGVVQNGWILGRGAGDMKGALASIITASRALQRSRINLRGDLLIHAVADEETGGRFGTRYLVEKGFVTRKKADMAVVMEGSTYDRRVYFRSAVGGLLWLEIVTKGRACHSSRPEEGINAVVKMAKILLTLDKHKCKHKPHRLLPSPTVAPGTMIKGGTKENIIPESCTAIVDIRAVPGMTQENILGEVGAILEGLKIEDPELKAEMRPKYWWPPAEPSESEEVFKIAKSAAEYVVGYDVTARGGPGSVDSSWLVETSRIPTVTFGPGDQRLTRTHGSDERVEIDKLVDFAKIYGLMAMEACGVVK